MTLTAATCRARGRPGAPTPRTTIQLAEAPEAARGSGGGEPSPRAVCADSLRERSAQTLSEGGVCNREARARVTLSPRRSVSGSIMQY